MVRPKCPRCASSNVRASALGLHKTYARKRKSSWTCSACGMRFTLGSAKGSQKPEPDSEREEQKMMEHELAIAADIQENLMPRRIPKVNGYELTAYYKPCLDVGGDYYDFVEVDQNHLGILVADVSGKGVPGALVMVAARAYTRSVASKSTNPKEIVSRVNALLHHDIPRGMFVTMYYCLLDLTKNILSCVSVGHNPMVYYRAATQSCHKVNPNGLALGIDRGPIFERTLKEQQIPIKPGDRFVIYTDGLVETMNKKDELYGDRRLYQKVKECAGLESSEFINLLVKNVEDFQDGAPQHDDITIITVRMLPHDAEAVEPASGSQ